MNSAPVTDLDFFQVFPMAITFVSQNLMPMIGISCGLVLGAGMLNFILKHFVSAKKFMDDMVL